MKKIFTIVLLGAFCMVNAQAFKGKGDFKGQVGLTAQNGGNGLFVSADFGLGENISIGASSSLLLGLPSDYNYGVLDKFDARIRFNANLGNVFKLDKKMDIYPGLDLGLRNLGAHVGFRYFFTDGFGVFAEACAPIQSYSNDKTKDFYKMNNQFTANIGASFNIN